MIEIFKLAEGGSGFYRTSKGKKAHRSEYCANARRSLYSRVHEIPAAEIKSWTPCFHCCSAAEIEMYWKAPVEGPAKCANAGITHPGQRRLYSNCSTCGKHGAVNRSTGRLRAHFPAK